MSSVSAGGQTCAAIADRNVVGLIANLHELAAAERKYYCKLTNIKSSLLQPLLKLGICVCVCFILKIEWMKTIAFDEKKFLYVGRIFKLCTRPRLHRTPPESDQSIQPPVTVDRSELCILDLLPAPLTRSPRPDSP